MVPGRKKLHVNSLYHASMRTYIVNMPHQNIGGVKSAVLKSIDVLTSLQLLLPIGTMCMCVCVCTVCIVKRIFSGFDNEKPLIFP